MKLLLSCLVLSVCGLLAFGQSRSQKLREFKASETSSPVPIVFGRKDDGLPEKMIVRGTIKDLTFAGARCGFLALSGTLRVMLDEKIPDYPHKDVFIVVSCFPEFEKSGSHRDHYIDKPVVLTLSKLYPEYKFGVLENIKQVPCAFGIITNRIDSKNIPFYCTQDDISEGIEKSFIKDNNLPEMHW